jgi:glycosyltransferase involved in cell wall biosynthesis
MIQSLRVLQISGEYPPMEGGVADFTAILAERMAAQGAEVQVLTSHAAESAVAPVAVHPDVRRWDVVSLWKAITRLRRSFDPQVIDIQYQTAAYGMRPAINLLPRLLRGLPCVVTFHDLKAPYLFPKAGPVRSWVNHELARGCRAAIATNAEDLASLRTWAGVRRTALIPIGSNVTPALPDGYDRVVWRLRYGVAESALLLCYFGFLNATKGGEELVAALAALVQTGRDAYLLMIGGAVGASDDTNAAYLALVRQQIAVRDLEGRVVWTGHVSQAEVSAAFAAADICVLPYRDGVSFRRGSLMAALAHGLPIVSTHPRAPLAEIEHGANVWLVDASNADALAAAVARLADDGGLRARLGQGALALAQRFDWDEIAAQTLALLRQVSTTREAGGAA